MARKQGIVLTPAQFEALSAQANAAQEAGLVESDEETEPTAAEQDLAAAERDEENDIFAALLELQGAREARWQIHRMLPSEKAGFVTEMSGPELTLLNITRKCGAGKYKILGVNSKGRYIGSRVIQIAPAEIPDVVPAPANNVQDVLAILRDDRERRKDEAFKWASLILPALGPVLGQLFGQRGPTLAELTTTLQNMRQLAGGDESQASKVEELARLIEVVKSLGGENATGAGWLDLARDAIKEGGPVISGLLQAMANRAPRPALPAPQPVARPGTLLPVNPNPTPQPIPVPMPAAVVPAIPPEQESDPMMRVLMWLQGQVPGLLQKAARNLDPEIYAAVLLDELPAGTDALAVRNYMARDDWWNWVIKFVPQAAPHQEWLTELRDALIEEIDAMVKEATGAGMPNVNSNLACVMGGMMHTFGPDGKCVGCGKQMNAEGEISNG